MKIRETTVIAVLLFISAMALIFVNVKLDESSNERIILYFVPILIAVLSGRVYRLKNKQ